ncbi:MAG TPA: hypothetical protein PLJ21_12945, partial [Pseudobdellovibrionaceae bacterium]|nr:hypothetical protein [Pseudobdellovibrionaceae bacterium]
MKTLSKNKTAPSHELCRIFTYLISETNGLSLNDTLNLILKNNSSEVSESSRKEIQQFQKLMNQFIINEIPIQKLLSHPVSEALLKFLNNFPLKYKEEHIHLTGSLTSEFIYPRLKKLLDGPHKKLYMTKIKEVYGEQALPLRGPEDVDRLIRLKENEGFDRYLKILYLPKLILVDQKAHEEASYHMAQELFTTYNVGSIRLKFSLSRATSSSDEQLPSGDNLSSEEVVLGLYNGFKKFQKTHPDFKFILSPSFRKESNFFNSKLFKTRQEHFHSQVNELVELIEKYPYLSEHLKDVDTVGDEKSLYRKEHFNELKSGFRKLRYRGFQIRSHHGETFLTLNRGIQAVDNAMNIWQIDSLEHGISLGINPNRYFHEIFLQAQALNQKSMAITEKHTFYQEIQDLHWGDSKKILQKLNSGKKLNEQEQLLFLKAKFHTATEVEHYQHDVLNRLIQK